MVSQADVFIDSIGVAAHLTFGGASNYSGDDPAHYDRIILPAVKASRIRHFRDGYFNLPDQRPQWTRYVIQQKKLITDMMAFNGTRIGFNLVFPNPPCAGSWLDAAKNPPSAIAVWLPMANLDSFESLNEYNFQTPHCGNNSWAALLHQYQIDFYNACKSFAPTVPVVGPSMGNHGNIAGDATSAGDISAYMDFGNIHSYPGGSPPTAGLDQIGMVAPMSGAKPVMATETGYHNELYMPPTCRAQPAVSQRAAAKYYTRLFFEYWNAGVARTYAYELLDDTSSIRTSGPCVAPLGGPEANFGLCTRCGDLKLQGIAIANIIALMADPGAAFTPVDLAYQITDSTGGPPPSTIKSAQFQKRSGAWWLAIWNDVPSYDTVNWADLNPPTVSVVLDSPLTFSTMRLYDPYVPSSAGATIPPAPITTYTKQHRIVVAVPDHALLIEMVP
jgi:hypothetical protein